MSDRLTPGTLIGVVLQWIALVPFGLGGMIIANKRAFYGCRSAPKTVLDWFVRECRPGQQHELFAASVLMLVGGVLFGIGRWIARRGGLD